MIDANHINKLSRVLDDGYRHAAALFRTANDAVPPTWRKDLERHYLAVTGQINAAAARSRELLSALGSHRELSREELTRVWALTRSLEDTRTKIASMLAVVSQRVRELDSGKVPVAYFTPSTVVAQRICRSNLTALVVGLRDIDTKAEQARVALERTAARI